METFDLVIAGSQPITEISADLIAVRQVTDESRR
jgi:hypothetical protein